MINFISLKIIKRKIENRRKFEMENLVYLAPIAGVIALIFAAYKAVVIGKAKPGNERMVEISDAIAEGAKAFLYSEYKVLVIFAAVLFIVIGFGVSWLTAVCFLVGAAFSTLAGYFGMTVATKANVRTANAAKESGMNKALSIAFSGGAVMGLCVVGLGIVGLSVIFIVLNATTGITSNSVSILTGFSLGASSIALLQELVVVSIQRQQTLVLTLLVKLKLVFLKMIQETRQLSLIT